MFDLEDEDLWLHVEFGALRGIGKHVDYQFAIYALIMMLMIIIIITNPRRLGRPSAGWA